MMQYKIIHGSDFELENFVNRINGDCEIGWKPLGGLAVIQSRTGLPRYFQAMVRDLINPFDPTDFMEIEKEKS